jgi:hypothetical protein
MLYGPAKERCWPLLLHMPRPGGSWRVRWHQYHPVICRWPTCTCIVGYVTLVNPGSESALDYWTWNAAYIPKGNLWGNHRLPNRTKILAGTVHRSSREHIPVLHPLERQIPAPQQALPPARASGTASQQAASYPLAVLEQRLSLRAQTPRGAVRRSAYCTCMPMHSRPRVRPSSRRALSR